MTHPESQDLLLDLAYGELPALRAAELEVHLAGCAECQREKAAIDEARRLSAPLRQVEEPPRGFDDRILAAARAQSQLDHGGNIGQVVEVQGSVRPMGLEPAQIDAHAKVTLREATRRPRWMVRVALGGSVAGAAALALVMSTSLQRKHEVEQAAVTAGPAFEIRIQPAPVPQAAGEAVREAKKEEAAHARLAPGAAERRQEGAAAEEAASKRKSGEARLGKRAAAPEDLARPGALGAVRGGSGGDALDAIASREPSPPPAPAARPPPPSPAAATAPPPASASAPPPPPAAATAPPPSPAVARLRSTADAPRLPAAAAAAAAAAENSTAGNEAQPPAQKKSAARKDAPSPAAQFEEPRASVAMAQSRSSQVASASPPVATPAAKALAPAPSAAELEQQAQEARHGGGYPLAAALYRKAAELRRAEAPQGNEGAWDLAHAVECLAAAGRFDEAGTVRDQLAKLYPSESGAFAAAGRVLREVDAPAQRNSKAKPKSEDSATVPVDF